jgi:glucokinase
MIAGVDIGGTKIAMGLVDDTGKVITRFDIPVEVDRGPASARDSMLRVMRELKADGGFTGIGIGSTGPVDTITGEFGDVNTLPGWQGWNPMEELADAFHVKIALENDADAAALGEARWGAGKGKRSLIGLTVGTGIGAGIILDGNIYRGAGNAHPEIGHHIMEPAGPLCTCGAIGCWESLAAGPAIEQWFAEQNPDSAARTCKEICRMARAGDAAAQRAVDRLAMYLGIGLSNVIHMLMPEVIALSGSVMQSADLLLDKMRAVVRNNCRVVPSEFCEITLSLLGADAGLIGAAEVWHNRFEHSPEEK